MNASKE